MAAREILVRNGLFFDGKGSPGVRRDVLVRDGRVAEISTTPLTASPDAKVIDADGQWVVPGFVDLHTHYDAEVEAIPSLHESLRHGVTTVFMGSCSLSTAVGDATDIADMFTRVEAIPYAHLLPLMRERKTWDTHAEYAEHLESLPLGPNVASFVGYSAVRAKVLGLERALDAKVEPTEEELRAMERLCEEGYDAGFLGLSVNGLYWDKMGGDRFRSRCLPSTYASWKELRRVVRGVRARGLNLQAIPNISTKYQIFAYAAFSAGLFVRPGLRTSIVSIMDLKSNRLIWQALRALGWTVNNVLQGPFRYQFLPVPFDLWADGFENVVFEEFGAGAAGLHLETMAERRALFRDPAYRRWFRSNWRNPFIPKVFHRNFGMAVVKKCPDASMVGKTFHEIARERGTSDVDAFLDLVAEHGNELRWYTVNGNDRPGPVGAMMKSRSSLIGFSDAGAHLRNMAFYNYPLRMLRVVKDAAARGTPVMPLEEAIRKLTSEIAEFFHVDAGTLEIGGRADLVVIDPTHLDDSVDAIHEAPIPELGGYVRLVRRNPDAVPAVLVNGELVVERGEVLPDVGRTRGTGRFLRARPGAERSDRAERRRSGSSRSRVDPRAA
ncbi:MAG: amidohydrolase family protein [Myxococcales bacterium]|nr:amidohydrolase family protein [Myxococcales bacterium]